MTPTKIPKVHTIQMTSKVIFGICTSIVLLTLACFLVYQYLFNNWLQPTTRYECSLTHIKGFTSQEKHQIIDKISATYKVSKGYVANVIDIVEVNTQQGWPDRYTVLAVILTESSFQQFAKSKVGAKGLMGVMPNVETLKWEQYHPVNNIFNGTQVLKEQFKMAKDKDKALEYYNVGYGNYHRRHIRNPDYVSKVNNFVGWLKSS